MSSTALNLSSSRLRTSTPTRAIHSTLTARASPSIPPATQTYEPLVKAVLLHRLIYSIFSYSAGLSWALTVIWTTWDQGGLSNIGLVGILYNMISPSVWVLAAFNWAIGPLPVVILRKTYLTTKPSTTPSPSKTFHSALAKPSTIRALLTYIISAVLTTLLHVLVAYLDTSASGDPHLTIFVRSRKHPYYLNGRFVFVMFSQIGLACTFMLRSVMLDRFAFRVTSLASIGPRWPMTFSHLFKTTVTCTIFTFFSLIISTLLFGLTRSILLPIFFKIPILHQILRPFGAHFLRGGWTLWLPMRNLSLVFRTFFLAFSTVASWEWAEQLFDVFVSKPVVVSFTTADPVLTLISGITSNSDDYYRYFSYSELKTLAMDDSPTASAKRTALFGDQKYNPNQWSSLTRGALLLLGNDYQLLLRRGGSAPAVPAPTPAPPPKGPETPRTPLIRKAILNKSTDQSSLSSILDSFASDSKLTQALESTAETGASHIPEIFRSVENFIRVPPNTPANTSAKPKAIQGPTLVENAKKTLSGHVGRGKDWVAGRVPELVKEIVRWGSDWWTTERVSKVVEGWLPRRDLDIVVIDVLSHLVCASLSEDRYGSVQRDIPRILEALLTFLGAVEDSQEEINAKHPKPSDEILKTMNPKDLEELMRVQYEVAKASEILDHVSGALKEGVARIVRTFGDKLLAFKFTPRTARKLQGFIDYN